MSKTSQVFSCLILIVTAVCAYQMGRHFGWQSSVESSENQERTTVYYPVEDLVTRCRGAGESDEPDFETLVEMITTVIAPGTWNDEQVVTAVPANRLLAVTHSKNVHQEIAKLLVQCRQQFGYYHECVAKNVCTHCGAIPMPNVGDRCDNCELLRCEPRFDPPKIASLLPAQR